jgi:hypothetical protein
MLLDYALAMACITSDTKIDNPPCSLQAIQLVALTLELMDSREIAYCDLELLQQRYKTLRDAPPACDAIRFLERELIRDLMTRNRKYREWLEQRKSLTHEEWIDEALVETERLYRIYDLVCDATCPYYYVSVRRKALLDLRKEIGEQAYYAGVLPAHVPVWFYRRAD